MAVWGLVWQARCGLSSYGVSGSGQERFVEVCQVWYGRARFGKVRFGVYWQARRVPARLVVAR